LAKNGDSPIVSLPDKPPPSTYKKETQVVKQNIITSTIILLAI